MTVHYAVIDATTKAWKRFGTCDANDVALQASEPNEVSFVCPPEVSSAIKKKQSSYGAMRDRTGRFLTDEERGPLDLPYKPELDGGTATILALAGSVAPILSAIAAKKPK